MAIVEIRKRKYSTVMIADDCISYDKAAIQRCLEEAAYYNSRIQEEMLRANKKEAAKKEI